MRTQSRDTDPGAEAALVAMLRQATPCQRLARVRSLSETTLSLSRRAIARRHPHVDDTELRALFVRYQYGQELAGRVRQYLKNRSHEEA